MYFSNSQLLSITVLILFFSGVAVLPGQEKNKGEVYDKIYADWYHNVFTNTDPNIKAQVELMRVYLGYKYTINEQFSTDALFDVVRVNPVTGGTATFDTSKKTVALAFKIDERYLAYVKYANLAWKDILPKTKLTLGLIPYFAFDVQEAFWGYRYIYKPFMDQNGMEPSADLGVSVRVNPLDTLKIVAGIVNGEGYKSSQDIFGESKSALGLQVNPFNVFIIYLYSDWMPFNGSWDHGQTTLAVFLGFKLENVLKIGAEYDIQWQQKGIYDHDFNGVSVYGTIFPFKKHKQIEIFGRYDYAFSKNDWNILLDGQTAIAGLQYSPISKVKFALDWQLFEPKSSEGIRTNRVYVNTEFAY